MTNPIDPSLLAQKALMDQLAAGRDPWPGLPPQRPTCDGTNHRWSKWTNYNQTYKRHGGFWKESVSSFQIRQKRTCYDCNFIQDEKVADPTDDVR